MNFIYCVYAFNKNYELVPGNAESEDEGNESSDNKDKSSTKEKYKVFTFKYLIEKIMAYCEDEVTQKVKEVAKWKLNSTENFLESMLINRQDRIAAEFGNYYSIRADEKLLVFAIKNSNSLFLKEALRSSLIPAIMLNQPQMILTILEILHEGTKTELILNVLIYADFSRWKQTDIKTFIDYVSAIVDSSEQNLMYKCYNPVLTICLCCENLMKIGNAISFFKHESDNLSIEL